MYRTKLFLDYVRTFYHIVSLNGNAILSFEQTVGAS